MTRLYLSPPDVGDAEREAVDAAIRSGWVAPAGPDLTAFEEEVAAVGGRAHGVGLASGTAAIHLALLHLGVGPGDDVIASTFTFSASVNPIVYCGARPVLIDSEPNTWNLSPDLLAEELAERARRGTQAKAVVVVDLYGQCADYDRILAVCAEHGVPVVEDAAEAIGATYQGRPAGSFGAVGVFSFNGNKIITTSGGGMLVTDDADLATHARHLATQARDPAPHYEHSEIGFNYRLSNLLAALGRAQLASLPGKIARRRAINARYREELGRLDGISVQSIADGHEPNCWLTCITVDPEVTGVIPEDLRLALEAEDMEARPTWKPMHLQPVFADAPKRVDGTSERLFTTGLCLPSGSAMSRDDQDRVIAVLVDQLSRR
jgi:dTDP-4-amino-4,6-dideoxygalactose transaminase